MEASALVSEQEYLHSAYEPDCDFVDGVLVERNVGESDHSILQREVMFYFRTRRDEWRVRVFPGQRIRVGPRRYRIPDLCVYREPAPREKVFTTPPFIAIEILSSEDRMSRVRQRIDDYLAFGVPHVWVIDPETRKCDVYTPEGFYEAKDLMLRAGELVVPMAEIFRALDE